jgi:hypothetical protein
VKKHALALLALTIALTLAGCAAPEDKAATVKEKADSEAAVTSEAASEESETEEPTEEPTEEEEAAGTAAIGDLVTVGDWDVKVTEVVMDAAAEIKKANQFNEKAKGKYVLVTYEATYNGSERTADIFSDLTWTFTGNDQQVNNAASVVTPADNEEWPTSARTGGTVKGQAIFDLDPAVTIGGLLTVEGYDENFDTIYADFAITG